MKFDPDRHRRRSIRLAGYDYRQAGAYYVTICTYQRGCSLGDVHNQTITLSPAGQIVERCWRALPEHFAFVDLDTFVIMPNHLHGIIIIKNVRSEAVTPPAERCKPSLARGTQAASLTALVQNFKSVSSRKINQACQRYGSPIWQRGYYERVIRDETELGRIRRYIEANPARWADST